MFPLTSAIVINVGGCSTCWIWWVPRHTGAISHSTAGLDYQLITTTSCREDSTFHCHSSSLDQVLTWPVQMT